MHVLSLGVMRLLLLGVVHLLLGLGIAATTECYVITLGIALLGACGERAVLRVILDHFESFYIGPRALNFATTFV